MIEQLLMRIAKRGPSLNTLELADVIAPRYGTDSVLSSRFPVSKAPSDSQFKHKNAAEAWEQAIDAYLQNSKPVSAEAKPLAYASFTEVHAQIGSLIWQEHKSFSNHIVHIINSNGDVVAEINPSERTVAVRKHLSNVKSDLLSIKELPQSAKPFSSGAASHFENTTAHMLLWYYGQAMPEAVRNIPMSLVKGKMLLRKLPLVPPSALQVRHLHLISLFSPGAIYLPTLMSQLNTEAIQSVCADLASLYLTGCLVSNNSKELSP